MTPVLSRRALNRACSSGSFFFGACGSRLDVIEHLVGMQAQVPSDPYLALSLRIEGFRTDPERDAVG